MSHFLITRLTEAANQFAASAQPLTEAQCQQSIRLLREVETALQPIPKPAIHLFREAALVQPAHAEEPRPVLGVDEMEALCRAREQQETLLLRLMALAPHGTTHADATFQERRAFNMALLRLAQTLEALPAFAPAESAPRPLFRLVLSRIQR